MKTYRCLSLLLAVSIVAAMAQGAITAPLPLKKMMEDSNYVVMTKVAKLDPQAKRMVVTLTEDIKGKATFRQVPILLDGDSEGKKGKHSEMLMERLAADVPVLIFIGHKPEINSFTALGYTNGTWFSLKGTGSADNPGVWELTHGEPYLRRTYTGTTEELRKLLVAFMAGKAKLPGINEKEKAGFGPKLSP